MITKNDMKIADWINKLKAVQTQHIRDYWFENYTSDKSKNVKISQRSNSIREYGKLKVTQDHIDSQNIYYSCAKRHIEHQLPLANFICRLKQIKGSKLEDNHWQTDYCIEDIIADMALIYKIRDSDGHWHIMFVESHNKSDKFDFMKYENLYNSDKYEKFYKDFFGYIPKMEHLPFPKVIIITDRDIKIPESDIVYVKIDSKCKNIRRIFG